MKTFPLQQKLIEKINLKSFVEYFDISDETLSIFPMMSRLRVVLIFLSVLSEISGSWVRILNSPRVLQSDIQIGYKIDNLDPARFNDIHSLLYAGSELLYAARVPGGEGVLKVPCGVKYVSQLIVLV